MSPVLTIDVAHPSRKPDVVEEELLSAWSRLRNSPNLHILKVIHGHGSSEKGSSTKETVRNWAFQNRARFRRVIEGEKYSLYDATTQELRKEVGDYDDPDIGQTNAGITIIWIK